MIKEKDFCLYCGKELDYKPRDEDGGFCSVECEDNWNFTGSSEEANDEV